MKKFVVKNKKFIVLILAFVCVLSFAACTIGNDGGNSGNGGTEIILPDLPNDDNGNKEDGDISTNTSYTASTRISDVINEPVFGDWGRMIFPVNSGYYSGSTLGNLSLTWYRNINVAHTVEICNYFKDQTIAGNQVFYDIYTAEGWFDQAVAFWERNS